MNPLVKGILGALLINVGGLVWYGYVGTWTLTGLVAIMVGSWLVGTVSAEASFK